ncbi:MAG TPA: protein-disulfide reductase DsbD N-terminal domain-containing protein [Mucilaginibacter sp.]|nr:protein-disulfide reductase DsbD N-terminal domain-containing protein [Mucilaginibacter sp.]
MRKIIGLITILLLSTGAFAQIEHPVTWSYAAKKINKNEAVVFIRATIQKGWHIYSQNVKDGGPVKTSFTFSPSKEYALTGKTSEPTPITKYEEAFKMDVSYFENTVTFQQKIKLKAANASSVKGQLEFMVCNDRKCLPPDDVDFNIPLGK